jgi:hypothetical protein
LSITTNELTETGAIFLNQDGNGTGILLDSESTKHAGEAISMPTIAYDVNSKAVNPHLLFGYNDLFDVRMYRSAALTLVTNGHFLPELDNSQDLGSDTKRWRDLYLGPNTLHIGTSGDEAEIEYSTSNDELGFDPDDDGVYEVTFEDTGKVGFNTVSPSATVDVGGASVGHVDGTNDLIVADDVEIDGTVFIDGLTTGVDNTVLVKDTNNQIVTDEIDSRVWGTTMTDGSGVQNYVTKWSDTNSLTTSQLFDNGTNVGIGDITPETKLEVVGTASGISLHAQRDLTSSGSLTWESAASGSSLWVSTFNGAGLADCDNGTSSKLLWDATTKRFSCGTDQSGGGTATLQSAYDNDVDGSDATIATNSTDDSVRIDNPSSGGTDSLSIFEVENDTAGKINVEIDQNANGTGALIDSEATSKAGLAISMPTITTDGSSIAKNPHILFGYNSTWDVDLFRQAADVLRTDDVFQASKLDIDNLATDGGIVYSDGTYLQNTAAGSSGQLLVSQGTAAPAFTNFTSTMIWYIDGAVATGAGQGATVVMPFGFTVTDVDMYAETAPTGASLIVDINEAGTTLFSTRPEVDAAANREDGNHAFSDTSIAAGALVTLDVDQVGSGTAGSDLTVILKGTRKY